MNKICLNMIVKDETEVIERCLASVRPYIDAYVIADTGSTDDTVAKIERALSGLPGKIVHHEWKSHGKNRSLALEAAYEAGLGDYFLFMDADFTFETEPRFSLADLSLDSYHVRLLDGETSWHLRLLVSSKVKWTYRGDAHAVITPLSGRPSLGTLEHAFVKVGRGKVRASGGGDAKAKSDIELFLKRLEEAPGDTRAMFYLAQCHKDLGQLEEAREWYARRAERHMAFPEEAFMAQLELARIHAALESPSDIVRAAFVRAAEMRPFRAEPYYHLGRYHRERGEHAEAFMAMAAAKDLRRPTSEILFVTESIYEWRALDEYAMAAYKIGQKDQAYEAWVELLHSRKLPDDQRERVVCNKRLVYPAFEKMAAIMSKKTVGVVMPTIRERIESAAFVVSSLLHQVDSIHLHLVGYDEVPAFAEHEKIRTFLHPEGTGPLVRWSVLPDTDYVLGCDDDIAYPQDYVATITKELEARGPSKVVSYHVSTWSKGETAFARRVCFACLATHDHDCLGTMFGCGVSGFHRETLEVLALDHLDPAFSHNDDLFMSARAQEAGFMVVRPPNREGFLRATPCPGRLGLWERAQQDGFRERDDLLRGLVARGFRQSLEIDSIEQAYWHHRYARLSGLRIVGRQDKSAEQNAAEYRDASLQISAMIAEDFGLPPNVGLSVLDLGYGIGYYAILCAGLSVGRYRGYDFVGVPVSGLPEHYELLCADITEPFEHDERFDLILLIDVAFHVLDDERFEGLLRNVASHAKPHARVYVTGLFEDTENNGHVRHRTLEAYGRLGEATILGPFRDTKIARIVVPG